jgi:predicted nucleic acid-binding protein
MTTVIDASVAIRAIGGDEAGSEQARSVVYGAADAVAPSLLLLEFQHVFSKRYAAGLVAREHFEGAAVGLSRLVEMRPLDRALADEAVALSLAAMSALAGAGDGRPFPASVYDCAYVALAIMENAELVTCDAGQARLAERCGCRVRLLA